MKSDLDSRIDEWSKPPFDKSTQLAILKLRENPEDLEDAFYKDLDLKEWLSGYQGFILDSNNILIDKDINILKTLKINFKIVGRGDL